MIDIVRELTNIYLEKEFWHKKKLSIEDSNKYHEKLLMQGNILTYVKDDALVGYVEVWRINYEQLGRILCEKPFFVFDENITGGNIAYIHNMWIAPESRMILVKKEIFRDFISKFSDCEFLFLRRVKWNYMFKVYPMKNFIRS